MDQLYSFLCNFLRISCYDGHRIADIADFLLCQDPALLLAHIPVVRNVLGQQHCPYTVQGQRLADIDIQNFSVCIRAVDQASVDHIPHKQII